MANQLHNVVYNVTTNGSTSSSFNKMFDTIDKISEQVNKLNSEKISPGVDKKALKGLDDISKKASEASSKIGGYMDNLNSKMAGFAGNIPFVGGMIEKAMLALGPYGVIISGLVAGLGAIGAVLFNTSGEIDKVKDQFRGFADSEETLTQLSNSSRALQKTFEDFDAKVYADNIKVMANEFNISQQEANKLNEQMVKLSSNQVDPDNVREYATQFAKLGLSAEEFTNSLINQKSMGIYMDKGVDSVKELGLRMNKMSDLGKQAFQNVGINIDDMSNKVNSGKMKMSAMLTEIGKKMGKAGLANKQTLITEAFGAPGEDAGKNLDKYLQSFGEAQSKMTKAEQERFDRNKRLAEQQEKTTKGLNIIAYKFQEVIGNAGSVAWQVLAPFTEFFIDSWYKVSEYISSLFGDMNIQTQDIIKSLEWVLDFVGKVFSVIGKVIKTIWTVIKAVGTFLDKLLVDFGGLSGVWDSFLSGLMEGVTWIGYMADEVSDLFNALTELAKGNYSNASKFMEHADVINRASQGDKQAIKQLNDEQAKIDKKVNDQKLADRKAYELKDNQKKIEEEKLTNKKLENQISGSLTNSATGASSSVKNINIEFEALQKIMGNQILGTQDSRKILDDMNEGFMQILNNTNQISSK